MFSSGRKRKAPSELSSELYVSFAKAKPGPSNLTKPCAGNSDLTCNFKDCFLQELSDPSSDYVINFKNIKSELCEKLYSFYNSTIFEGKLPQNMDIKWNKRMRKTAGKCDTWVDNKINNKPCASIELANKIIDSAERLRDALVHEMCHAATWLIDGIEGGHGQPWRKYTTKATTAHPELPPINTYHEYEIFYKYTYKCSGCTQKYHRHSRSLKKYVCGVCEAKLILCKN